MPPDPTTLIKRVAQVLRLQGALKPGTRYLLAVSGGRDSMALAMLFLELSRRWRLEVVLGHVDHGLRPDSPLDWELVQRFAHQHHLPCLLRQVDIDSHMGRSGNTQDIARQLRYAALEEMRQEADLDWIVTAHHADDQAETLLLHFLRGAGVHGLAGMPLQRGRILRPLLSVSRSELEAYTQELGVQWNEDSSNAQDYYLRNALRHHVLPSIREKINPGVTAVLGDTASLFQSLSLWLDARTDELVRVCITSGKDMVHIAVAPLNQYFEFERLMVLGRALALALGSPPSHDGIQALNALLTCQTGRRRILSPKWTAIREKDGILLQGPDLPRHTLSVNAGAEVICGDFVFTSSVVKETRIDTKQDPCIEWCDAARIGREWMLRPVQSGDRFQPFGSRRECSVLAFLSRQGLSKEARRRAWVLEQHGRVLWVCGYRLDHRIRVTADTQEIMELQIRPLPESS